MAPNSNMIPSASRNQLRKRKYNSDGDLSDDEGFSPKSGSPSIDDDRRAHHNELERRRRDHIKDHFVALKNSIPLLEGEKSSRALILKRAVDYISLLQAQLKESKLEIEDQKRRNDQFRHHAALGLINQTAAVAPQPPAPVFSLPTTATSAFNCINLPSTSSANFSPSSTVVPITDCVKPASPICTAATGASTFAASLPVLQNEQAAKQALLSSLLLQNFGQLIQPQPQHSTLTDFGGHNFLAARQLAAQL
ncbi:hypothetical protein FO519_004212 [Halicephalobus sp. NKZ332]|nr:hypothetical protein FO519_004212 [Halicephalobus sp. NKZ332]